MSSSSTAYPFDVGWTRQSSTSSSSQFPVAVPLQTRCSSGSPTPSSSVGVLVSPPARGADSGGGIDTTVGISSSPSNSSSSSLSSTFGDCFDVPPPPPPSCRQPPSHADCLLATSRPVDQSPSPPPPPSDGRKLLASLVYFGVVSFGECFFTVVAHWRLPESGGPLPDIVLDRLPLWTWGFCAAEMTTAFLVAIFFTICLFHRFRSVTKFFTKEIGDQCSICRGFASNFSLGAQWRFNWGNGRGDCLQTPDLH